jgi:hypothetical protein
VVNPGRRVGARRRLRLAVYRCQPGHHSKFRRAAGAKPIPPLGTRPAYLYFRSRLGGGPGAPGLRAAGFPGRITAMRGGGVRDRGGSAGVANSCTDFRRESGQNYVEATPVSYIPLIGCGHFG